MTMTLDDLKPEHIGKQFYIARLERNLGGNTVVYCGYHEPHGLPTWRVLWHGMLQEIFGECWVLAPVVTETQEAPPSDASVFERALSDSL